jgi:Tfp pilus assembly pilus retraction ATPase PilT
MAAPDSLWNLVEEALSLGARTLHLAPGAPPLVRLPESPLSPIEAFPEHLTADSLEAMLRAVVDPQQWELLEREGDGEVTIADGGRPFRVALFLSQGRWAAVVRL